jgi:MATE family multidrug resistance protein
MPGGSRELLTLAMPLVVSHIDTVLPSWRDPLELAASFPAVMWLWLPFGLLLVSAGQEKGNVLGTFWFSGIP